jgi:divalent metal cation (Fe/Co/Zn/Cd) transporter
VSPTQLPSSSPSFIPTRFPSIVIDLDAEFSAAIDTNALADWVWAIIVLVCLFFCVIGVAVYNRRQRRQRMKPSLAINPSSAAFSNQKHALSDGFVVSSVNL